jgi:predicted amidophosphoribosyltransferase
MSHRIRPINKMKTNSVPPAEEGERAKEELEVCISCLQTNSPGTHFCAHCGTPLTSYAATGPFESIFAEGDFLRKAISPGRWKRPVRFTILVLLVLMLLATVAGVLLR